MRVEQRRLLRDERALGDAVPIIRGGRDSVDKLRRHACRTARAWSLDGHPLYGVSVFAVVDAPLEALLAGRFATFRAIHQTSVGRLSAGGFELLPTGLRPHLTVRLQTVDEREIEQLLVALGPARDNPEYGSRSIWREEV